MSIYMHANIIQQKRSTARWAISTRTKDKTYYQSSKIQIPLVFWTHTSVCKARGANPFRIYIKASGLTLARQATTQPFSWLTSQVITVCSQGRKARLAQSMCTTHRFFNPDPISPRDLLSKCPAMLWNSLVHPMEMLTSSDESQSCKPAMYFILHKGKK